LVEGGEDAEGVDEGGEFVGVAAVAFELEYALADFVEEVVVVIHLFDDFDEVGYEFVFDAVVAWVDGGVPRTEPITDILVAALSLREGLSLFSYSM
jgi:hypothetical protein